MFCPNCGFENLDSTTYCIKCGAPLVQAKNSLQGAQKKPPKSEEDSLDSMTMFTKGYVLGGRYQILSELGRGGMGRVFKAIDKELEEEVVALKVLLPQFSSDEKIMERFKREIRIARRITHPNVLRIYDLEQEGESLCISMELGGLSLSNILKSKGPMPVGRVVAIAKQLCWGLNAAHHEGIIHRDIKPQNILIADHDHVKIADFGIARAEDMSGLTTVDLVMGTPNYMSPEQVNADVQVDERSDIYSLGVVLFEMLTGRVPFQADTPIKTAFMHVQVKPPSPRTIKDDIPQWMENIVLKALEKDPAARFQTVVELADAMISQTVDRGAPFEDDKTIVKRMRPPVKPVQEEIEPEPAPPAEESTPVKGGPSKKTGVFAGLAAALIIVILVLKFLMPGPGEDVVEKKVPETVHYGKVDIFSSPGDAYIVLNDILLNVNTPTKLDKIESGVEHKIVIRKKGFQPYQKQFILKDNEQIAIETTLTALTGSLIVESDPSGAYVYLNNENTGFKTPYELKDSPLGSKYEITLKKEGYEDKRVNVEITEEGEERIPLMLSRIIEIPEPVIAYGQLRINSIPWTEVYMGNKLIGKTPLSISKIVAGKHELLLRNEEFAVAEKVSINVLKDQTFKKRFEFKGAITITSLPGTAVFIDGKNVGTVPIKNMSITVGFHALRLTNEKQKKEKVMKIKVMSDKVAKVDELFE